MDHFTQHLEKISIHDMHALYIKMTGTVNINLTARHVIVNHFLKCNF